MTILALPQEIWKLPSKEIDSVIKNVELWIEELQPILQRNKVKFNTLGGIQNTSVFEKIIKQTEDKTQNNKGITFTFAIDYSGKDEILRTYNKISEKEFQ